MSNPIPLRPSLTRPLQPAHTAFVPIRVLLCTAAPAWIHPCARLADSLLVARWFPHDNRSALIALQAQQGTDTVVHVLMGAGVAAAVTVARVALLQRWPEFKQATDASNSQVLTPLEGNVGEIAQVAVFPVRVRCCTLPHRNLTNLHVNSLGVVGEPFLGDGQGALLVL